MLLSRVELSWDQLTWAELNWIGLTLSWINLYWIEFDWLDSDWVELDWRDLDWFGLIWIELKWVKLNWLEMNRGDLSFVELSWIELSWMCQRCLRLRRKVYSEEGVYTRVNARLACKSNPEGLVQRRMHRAVGSVGLHLPRSVWHAVALTTKQLWSTMTRCQHRMLHRPLEWHGLQMQTWPMKS